jgi:serine protease Do
MDDQGHIVTNNHVVEGANELSVVLMDGSELPAQLIGRDPVSDLAVIKVAEKGLPYAEFGDSDTIEVGELAIALGSPMGTDFASSVTAGIISGLNRQVSIGDRTMDLIQTDAAINPGNSGGALVNSEGKVIGINVLKLSESSVEGMGFSIPINEAKPIIDQLIKNKKIVYPSIGISGSTISKEDAKTYALPQGVYVQSVIPYSGAERAGIKQGDIIIEVDGTKVLTIEEVIGIVTKHKVGDTIKVTITNQYNKNTVVDVTLTERPAQ